MSTKPNEAPNAAAIILAAGRGKRMRSQRPKVLHTIAGRPLIDHVLSRLQEAGIQDLCLVLGENHSDFEPFLAQNPKLAVCVQSRANGTAGAAGAAAAYLGYEGPAYSPSRLVRGHTCQADWTIVTPGDTPGISPSTIASFLRACQDSDSVLGVLAMQVPDPKGYGRIVCDTQGRLQRIVEEKDADSETQKITTVNTGLICARTNYLFDALRGITNDNQQNEYYLTDLFEHCPNGAYVHTTKDWQAFCGINNPEQLANFAGLAHK